MAFISLLDYTPNRNFLSISTYGLITMISGTDYTDKTTYHENTNEELTMGQHR